MAAITPIAWTPGGNTKLHNFPQLMVIRRALVLGTTGQVDWITIPVWAKYAKVYFTLVAASGTTPVTNLRVLEVDPAQMDDTYQMDIGGTTLTAQNTTGTSALSQTVDIGPGVTGIADDLVLGATGMNRASINTILPVVMGLSVVYDRTTGDELYTTSLSVALRSA